MKKPRVDIFEQVCQAKSGNKSAIATALRCSRRQVDRWIAKDAKFQQVYEDADEALVDLSETQLWNLIRGIPKIEKDADGKDKFVGWIQKPDIAAIIWSLKTRGKDRGWVERQEIMNMDANNFIDILKRANQRKESAK